MNKKVFAITIIMMISVLSFADDLNEFSGFVGRKDNTNYYRYGRAFNNFMLKQKNKKVKLDLTLDKVQKVDFSSSIKGPDELNRTYLFVENNSFESGDLRGVEYLIHLPKDSRDYHFKYNEDKGRLSGCFDVFNIVGPRQMIMSVNLKSIKCE